MHAVIQRFVDDDLSTAAEALDVKSANLLAQRQEKHLKAVRDELMQEVAEEAEATDERRSQLHWPTVSYRQE